MTAEQLLEEAASVIARRRGDYGQPIDLFQQVATRWSQVLGTKVMPAQVVICLIDLKVMRVAHNRSHLDSITDIAGCASILAELPPDA